MSNVFKFHTKDMYSEPQVQLLRNETYFIIILENVINLYVFKPHIPTVLNTCQIAILSVF